MLGTPVVAYQDVTHLYAMLVSTLGWISNRIGISIALAHSMLGRVMHAPTTPAFHAVKRVFRYIKGHQDLSLSFETPAQFHDYSDPHHVKPTFVIQSDSSFADNAADRKSQGGYFVELSGMAPYYWSVVSQGAYL